MRSFRSTLSLLVFCAIPLAAHADVVFSGSLDDVQGNIVGPPTYTQIGTFSGSFAGTTGTATVSITGRPDDVLNIFSDNGTDISFSDAASNVLDLSFVQGLSASGSEFCSVSNCPGGPESGYGGINPFGGGFLFSSEVYDSTSSFQAPTTAATPEPSSLILLGTGVLGAFGAVRRRLA